MRVLSADAGPPGLPSGAADAVRVALGRYFRVPSDDPNEVREVLRAFVRCRREAGDPPQEVLVAVKRLVADAGSCLADHGAYTALLNAAVRWCVDEYYRGTE